MQARMQWTVAALCGYAVLVLVGRQVTGLPGAAAAYVPWAYGAGYFVLGVILLGVVSRWWRAGSPALWRPLMLSLGSLAAALEIWTQPPGAVAVPLDRWMLALLGLLAVALLARLLPNHLTRLWLDLDRRLHDG